MNKLFLVVLLFLEKTSRQFTFKLRGLIVNLVLSRGSPSLRCLIRLWCHSGLEGQHAAVEGFSLKRQRPKLHLHWTFKARVLVVTRRWSLSFVNPHSLFISHLSLLCSIDASEVSYCYCRHWVLHGFFLEELNSYNIAFSPSCWCFFILKIVWFLTLFIHSSS